MMNRKLLMLAVVLCLVIGCRAHRDSLRRKSFMRDSPLNMKPPFHWVRTSEVPFTLQYLDSDGVVCATLYRSYDGIYESYGLGFGVRARELSETANEVLKNCNVSVAHSKAGEGR